jgi:hypothetical protein
MPGCIVVVERELGVSSDGRRATLAAPDPEPRVHRALHRLAALALALPLLLRPALAAADGSSELERARALAGEAEDSYRAGSFRRAAELYAQADALAPSASVKFSEASSWLKAGETAPAADAFEAALKLGTLDAERSETARVTLRELERKLAIVVVAEPVGARASLGQARARLVPARIHVAPGTHRVEVERRDGSKVSQSVELAPKETRQLRFADAPVRATAKPPPAAKPPAAPERGPHPMRVAGWSFLGLGALNALAAVPLGIVFLQRRSAFVEGGRTDATLRDEVKLLQGLTTAAVVGAAAAGGVGAALVLASPSERAPAVGLGAGWVSLRTSF